MTKQKEESQANNAVDFGGCPICHQNDGYLNLAKEHWFVCHRHQFRWCWGANLVSTWRLENETDWNRNWNLIKNYKECSAWFPAN